MSQGALNPQLIISRDRESHSGFCLHGHPAGV